MKSCGSAVLLTVLCASFAYQKAFAKPVDGVSETEIKIGTHGPLSGLLAAAGAYQGGFSAYIDEINAKGGVNGRKITVIPGDSAGNAQRALQVVKQQVEQDKIFALACAFGEPHRGVYNYLEKKNVPDLWIAGADPLYSVPVVKTRFTFTMPADVEGKFWADFVVRKFSDKNVGVIYRNDAYGRGAADAFKMVAEGKVKGVGYEAADAAVDPVARTQVLNFKRNGAQVILMLAVGPATSPSTINFAADQGYKPQWLVSANGTFLDRVSNERKEGTIGAHYVYSDNDVSVPGVKAHIENLKARLPNVKASLGTLAGQACAELTVETLKRAGRNLNRETLIEAAESFKDFKCSVCRMANSTGPKLHRFNTVFPLLINRAGNWIEYND